MPHHISAISDLYPSKRPAGVFRDVDSFGDSKGDGEYNVIARLTGAPCFVDSGNFKADSVNLLGLERALVYGPASVQMEFMRTSVDVPVGEDPDFVIKWSRSA